ncbi:class I adenylate-forming enzyme family protein [Alkalicoccus daliensis]|uniref:Long-chain acyl-CoA synthetase n=1 Tax=Alkalicoccus daliensis TaxID=745820 RepID=A0A1H0J094_9BACI|nr:AMP-binding protein [Alkalicoccus daliensis]SDO36983.1 long-chain acyl-CoA synthetase [Alkalicoccus daliensis]
MKLGSKRQPIYKYVQEHAGKTPEKAAINYYGREITYHELDQYSDRFAAYLMEKGIKKGDKVALYLQNSPQYIIANLGIQKAGAVTSPCNPMFKEWELEYQLNDLEAKVIVMLDALYPIFNNIRTNTKVEMVITTSYADFLPEEPYPVFPEPLKAKKEIVESVDLFKLITDASLSISKYPAVEMKEDVSLIVYTSGSTGAPKGAMLTFNNAEFKTKCMLNTYSFTSEDIFLSVMPVFHIAGMLVGLNSPLMAGGTIVLLTRFDPAAFLQAVEKYKATILYTTPPMNLDLIKRSETQQEKNDLTSLRLNLGTSFGIQVSEEISNKWEKVSGVPLFEFAYGMSETHTGDALMPPDNVKYGTVGKPTYETEIKIMDLEEPEKEMPQGKQGEIVVKSPSVFKGYLNKQEATQRSFHDSFFYTGDIGLMDEEGYLHFLGRNKEMIKSSGYSVFPEEVEKMLVQHPAVGEVAVVGIPDAKRGESVKAFIVLEEQAAFITEEELIQWAREKMSAYKYPREIEFTEALPKTTTGKLLRRLLKTNGNIKT